MRFTYDPEIDVLMVHLVDDQRERFSGGVQLPFGDAVADLDDTGAILSLEITEASKKYPREVLEAHPVSYGPLSLADAAAIAGVSQQALRRAIERGRLVGKKIGRNWTVTDKDLDDYLNSRWARDGQMAQAV
jgi:uncharacterized protein YuzE